MQNISRRNKWRLPLLYVSGHKIGILGPNLFGTMQVSSPEIGLPILSNKIDRLFLVTRCHAVAYKINPHQNQQV